MPGQLFTQYFLTDGIRATPIHPSPMANSDLAEPFGIPGAQRLS